MIENLRNQKPNHQQVEVHAEIEEKKLKETEEGNTPNNGYLKAEVR